MYRPPFNRDKANRTWSNIRSLSDYYDYFIKLLDSSFTAQEVFNYLQKNKKEVEKLEKPFIELQESLGKPFEEMMSESGYDKGFPFIHWWEEVEKILADYVSSGKGNVELKEITSKDERFKKITYEL